MLYPEAIEKPSLQPKIERPEILRITEAKKQPIIVAEVSEDPASGWKKILLDGDPISVTDIEKYFSESNVYGALTL